jgi:hypothetical protein
MTLCWLTNMLPESLTVPDEAVRGLKFKSRWVLRVSDPETVALTAFKIPLALEKKAAEDLNTDRPLNYKDGKKFMEWLLKQEYLDVERMDGKGRPSQGPQRKVAGPRPAMDRPAPNLSTPAIPPPPQISQDLNPADAPVKLAHPMDRPADMSF